MLESSRCRLGDWQECDQSPQLGRKMIKPDPDLVNSLLNFSDEESGDSGDDLEHDQDDDNTEQSQTILPGSSTKSSWRKQCKSGLIFTIFSPFSDNWIKIHHQDCNFRHKDQARMTCLFSVNCPVC